MRNLVSSLVFFFARVLAAVLQLKLIERLFGAQYAGLNALLNQLAFYVALIELGLAAAAISLLYEPLKAKDYPRASGLLAALQRDTLRLMLLALPVVAALVFGYAHSLHTTVPFFVVAATLALTAVSGLITLLSIHYQAYLNASEQIYQVQYVLGGGYLLKTAVGVGLAAYTRNYLMLPIAITGITVLEVLAMRWRFHAEFPQYIARATKDAFSEVRHRAKYVLAHRVGGLIYYQSDFVILSLVASLALIKDYAQVQYAAAGILGLTSAVFNAVTASIARRQLDVSTGVRWKQYATVLRGTYFLGVCVAIAFAWLGPAAVQLVFHSAGLPQITYLLFSALLFLNLIKQVDDTFITATGSFHVAFYLPLLESSTYVVAGVFLAWRYGINGIVVAGIATNLLFAVLGKSAVVARGVFQGEYVHMLRTKVIALALAFALAAPLLAAFFAISKFSLTPWMQLADLTVLTMLYTVPVLYVLVKRGYGHLPSPAHANVPDPQQGAA